MYAPTNSVIVNRHGSSADHDGRCFFFSVHARTPYEYIVPFITLNDDRHILCFLQLSNPTANFSKYDGAAVTQPYVLKQSSSR